MARRIARTGIALGIATVLAFVAAAQDAPPFLLLNQERILTGSAVGRALLAEEEAARDALRAEASAIDARFEAEERQLTQRRAELEPEAFRQIADDFDARVIEARREQDARSNALAAEFDTRRRQFYNEVGPILVTLLSRYGAFAVFDEGTVLLADQSLNITDAVIAEVDARAAETGTNVGEGEGVSSQPAPTTPPAPGGGLAFPGGSAEGTGQGDASRGSRALPLPAEGGDEPANTDLPSGDLEGGED
jgi:Skp family chaperone for outer membrane proteins